MAVPVNPAARAPAVGASSSPPFNSEVSILLVDDDHRNLDALESVLASPDFRLIRAASAQQALVLLLEGEFAAIVLDIQMPEMSGIELANLVKQRKRTQHIPIIFLTAFHQDDKDLLQGYEIGAVDYLTKPINPQILRSKVGVFVELFRKTRALAAANAALEFEVEQRLSAEAALVKANNDLEVRVHARTADLSRANAELRSREEALRASEAQALAASRAKDEFLAKLSHELRTPLNPVLLLATEAAQNPLLSSDVRGDFNTIARNVMLEARLIDDLLDLTRIAQGKLALEMQPINAHATLEDALQMVSEEMAEKKIVPKLQFSASQSVVIGDDVRLKQVFWNVIKNAAKFTPIAGEIIITTAQTNGHLLVSVNDTGIGMNAGELERVFKAFSQGDHSETDAHRFGGIGLGLAISRAIVELHAGSIHAVSAGRDRGTTVLIRLPLAVGSTTTDRGSTTSVEFTNSASLSKAGVGRRVLLVEDHKPTSLALKSLLGRRAHTVVIAGTLAEARTAIATSDFDLLVCDIGLPDGDGCDFMAELRERPGLVGLAVSGYGMEQDVTRSKAAGFIAHLTKPVIMSALDNALAAACECLDKRRQEVRSKSSGS